MPGLHRKSEMYVSVRTWTISALIRAFVVSVFVADIFSAHHALQSATNILAAAD